MKKYKITYRYVVEGITSVKANNLKEAKENIYDGDYGDNETVISNKIMKIEKINNNK
ncbi:MAG: hypothetical protein M0R03_14950 [Novosphingobium sp.]|nr:hypothetical protein [Novosphingobium sp.]